jgi:hypothetical protein
MPIDFDCPECGKPLRVKDKYAGEDVNCRHCRAPITIPAKRLERRREDSVDVEPVQPVRVQSGIGLGFNIAIGFALAIVLMVGLCCGGIGWLNSYERSKAEEMQGKQRKEEADAKLKAILQDFKDGKLTITETQRRLKQFQLDYFGSDAAKRAKELEEELLR